MLTVNHTSMDQDTITSQISYLDSEANHYRSEKSVIASFSTFSTYGYVYGGKSKYHRKKFLNDSWRSNYGFNLSIMAILRKNSFLKMYRVSYLKNL